MKTKVSTMPSKIVMTTQMGNISNSHTEQKSHKQKFHAKTLQTHLLLLYNNIDCSLNFKWTS